MWYLGIEGVKYVQVVSTRLAKRLDSTGGRGSSMKDPEVDKCVKTCTIADRVGKGNFVTAALRVPVPDESD